MSEFRAQLDSIGKIVEVTADGNCFFRFWTVFLSWILVDFFVPGVLLLWLCVLSFELPIVVCRAMSDQLESDEEQHMKYLEMVVQYIVVCDETDFFQIHVWFF